MTNNTIFMLNGTEVAADLGLCISIGKECEIILGHVDTLKPIYEEIIATGTYHFTEGEFLGYPHNYGVQTEGIDFYYYNSEGPIWSYHALSSSLQNKIDKIWGFQYEQAKISGLHPETYPCNPLNVGIENTVWGTWQYQIVPFDSYFDGLGERDFISDCSAFTFLHRNYTNPETYWENPLHPAENLSIDILGQYSDYYADEDIPGYNQTGISLVKQVEGDSLDGILELETTGGDWGWNISIYAKYQVLEYESGLEDDILKIEYFSSLSQAQNGFTEKNMTYSRFIHTTMQGSTPSKFKQRLTIGLSVSTLVVLLIISVVIVVKKKKK